MATITKKPMKRATSKVTKNLPPKATLKAGYSYPTFLGGVRVAAGDFNG